MLQTGDISSFRCAICVVRMLFLSEFFIFAIKEYENSRLSGLFCSGNSWERFVFGWYCYGVCCNVC